MGLSKDLFSSKPLQTLALQFGHALELIGKGERTDAEVLELLKSITAFNRQDYQKTNEIVPEETLAEAVDRAERASIQRALKRAGGSISQAATLLDIPSKKLWLKIRRLKIPMPQTPQS